MITHVPISRISELLCTLTHLQSLKSVSSVGDDSIGQVRPVIHEHFGKLRHCLMEYCSVSLLPIHCTSVSSGIVSWNVALSSPALFIVFYQFIALRPDVGT